ncbi:MAG: biopolymer transporter ExbD [Pedobacter sp.]|nr:MAG: biopolymer transporter ExbD [Pedobacter sp.]
MGRAKIQRKTLSVDMTAMSDVAFLLLNFFVMTSVFKPEDPLNVKLPSSTVSTQIPEKDATILTVGKNSIVFFETIGKDIKLATLEKMGEQYKIEFTAEEKKRFANIASFGIPIQNLKTYLMLDKEQRKKSNLQTGIPADAKNSQLAAWILNSRMAIAELHDTPVKLAVKADAEEQYSDIKKIIDILQDQKINKFSLITNQESTKSFD